MCVRLVLSTTFPANWPQAASTSTIEAFQDVLFKNGIRTMTRKTRGEDVDAACGQLAGKVVDKTKRTQT